MIIPTLNHQKGKAAVFLLIGIACALLVGGFALVSDKPQPSPQSDAGNTEQKEQTAHKNNQSETPDFTSVDETIASLRAQFPATVGANRYYDISRENRKVVYKITALQSDNVHYNKDSQNFADLKQQTKKQMRMAACINPAEISFFKSGIDTVSYDFIKKNGRHLMTIDVTAADCKLS